MPKWWATSWTTGERDDLRREVERVEMEIDDLVSELYCFTETERRLVEGVDYEVRSLGRCRL